MSENKLKKFVDNFNVDELAKNLHNRITIKQTGRTNILTWAELTCSTKEEHKVYMENLKEAINTLFVEPTKLAVELYHVTNQTTHDDSKVYFKEKELIPCYFCNLLCLELSVENPPTCLKCFNQGN